MRLEDSLTILLLLIIVVGLGWLIWSPPTREDDDNT